MSVKPLILLIDDEENLRRTLALILIREGYQVDSAATVKEARQQLQACTYDLTFLDIKLPDANGLSLLPELATLYPRMPVVILTAHDKLDAAVEAVTHGARDFLLKPIDPPLLIKRTKEILAESPSSDTLQERRTPVQTQLKPPPTRKPTTTSPHKKRTG